MQKFIILLITAAILLPGCATGSPVVPDIDGSPRIPDQTSQSIYDERHHLWGEWTWFIPENP